jgi:peptidoglycan/xylan/chitin deacetylase (PgdA/CDA1 family)
MQINGEEQKPSVDRAKRIRFLRRLILISISCAIIIPICLCLVLAIRYDRIKTRLSQAKEELSWYEQQYGESALAKGKGADKPLEGEDKPDEAKAASADDVAAAPKETEEEQTDKEKDLSENQDDKTEEILENADGNLTVGDGIRRVYITFDDGPSSKTGDILDILDEYDVEATFFVTGKPDTRYTDVYKRIVDSGHTLGMHSYSHKYSELYDSLEGFQEDLHKLQTFLYETTGTWSTRYRFPGGSSNTVSKVDMAELINYLALENITYYDWNVASGDDRNGITKDLIVTNVMTGVPKFDNSIILLHDASDKQATVDALPEIIEQVQALENTVIVPITDDTLPVQHISNTQ